ncbi:MAG: hypothetical protein ACXVJT_08095 [Thermoanaerobaculia bacterium]
MKYTVAAVLALTLLACGRTPPAPVNTMLMRLDAPWMYPSAAAGRSIRTAPATIVVFRASGEYVELHAWLLEHPDETLYISSREPRVAVLGTWKQKRAAIEITRTRVARTVAVNAPVDPLCAPVSLRISGNSVTGNAGGSGDGIYSPVTRLVSPDFESYVDQARRSPVTCGEEKK